jgi:hypothetical protein
VEFINFNCTSKIVLNVLKCGEKHRISQGISVSTPSFDSFQVSVVDVAKIIGFPHMEYE